MSTVINRKGKETKQNFRVKIGNGSKKLLQGTTKCIDFGKCTMKEDFSTVSDSDGMGKCNSCNHLEQSACILRTFPKEVFFKKEKTASKGNNGKNKHEYFFPKENTQAYKIDSCLKKGIFDIKKIMEKTSLGRARINLRINSIKKRKNCPYFA